MKAFDDFIIGMMLISILCLYGYIFINNSKIAEIKERIEVLEQKMIKEEP